MKNLIIKQLRERASVKGKQKTWASECSDDQLYLLFQKLRAGETARSIAQYVQSVWNINPASDIHSLLGDACPQSGHRIFNKRSERFAAAIQKRIQTRMMRDRNRSAMAVRNRRCRFRKDRAPVTTRPQLLQRVQREGIGLPQAGQRRASAAAGFLAARFHRRAPWTS